MGRDIVCRSPPAQTVIHQGGWTVLETAHLQLWLFEQLSVLGVHGNLTKRIATLFERRVREHATTCDEAIRTSCSALRKRPVSFDATVDFDIDVKSASNDGGTEFLDLFDHGWNVRLPPETRIDGHH